MPLALHRSPMKNLTLTMHSIPTGLLKKYNQYLIGLSCSYIFALLATVMLANRPVAVELLGNTIHWPGGIFFFPFIFVTLDIVTETYGPAAGRTLILVGFAAEFLLSILGIAVVNLGYPTYFGKDQAMAYQIVFESTFLFVLSSFFATVIAELINNHYLFKWKLKYHGKWFLIRSVLSIAIGQAVLTVLVDMLAFGTKYPLHELTLMMLHGYTWKMVCALILAVPSWLFVKHLKHLGIDSYESAKVNANPFG